MISCPTCQHWTVFYSQLHAVLVKNSFGSVDVRPPPEKELIATCSKGMSPIEGGKVISDCVDKCERYEVKERPFG